MYRKDLQGWLKHFDFLLLDIISLNLSIYIAFIIQKTFIKVEDTFLFFATDETAKFVVVANIAAAVTALMLHTYKNILKRGYYKELVSVIKFTATVFLATVLYIFSFENDSSDRIKVILYISAGIFFVLSYVIRVLYKKIVLYNLRNKEGSSLLLVTTSDIAEGVLNTLEETMLGEFSIKGLVIVDRDMTGSEINGYPVLANEKDAAEYVCRQWIDEVFVNVHNDDMYPYKLIDEFESMGLAIHIRLANREKMEEKHQLVERLGGYTVLTTTINYATPIQLFAKRLFDIIGGFVGSVATLLLCVFVAPMIYIKSPGPIFFKQERVGKNGKKFKIYKFRTMYLDAEERKKELMEENRVKDGMMFKLDFDPRIIGSKKLDNGKIKKGIGGWLRILSIDEFPQFFNVLKGEMSLVGTRPPTVDEWEKYELHHRARLAIKPGVTGMWQVSGRSKITDFEKVVRLDTMYIREWSVLLDIKILFKTVFTVLKREGSM